MNMMPVSFIGYGLDLGRHGLGLYVKICTHCPDHAALEAWAKKKGTPVRHLICEACANKQNCRITGEQIPA